MKSRTLLTGVAAACAATLFTAGLVAQQKQDKEHPEHPKAAGKTQDAPSAEQEAFMEAWMAYATPGPQHQQLAAKAGKWSVAGQHWFAPDSVPEAFGGIATFTVIMDGRFLLEDVVGDEHEGMIFKGQGIIGFDNMTQKFVTSWIDNMGTGIVSSQGTTGKDGTINYTGEHPDFLTGKYKKVRSTERKVGETYVHVMYDTTPNGQEYKAMEITYTRAN